MAPPVNAVTVAAFAEILGRTPERVYQLIQQGMPHRKLARSTKIVPAEAIQWLRDRDVEKAAKPAEAPAAELVEAVERARKLRAEADLKELDLAERRGQLVQVEIHTETVDKFLGGLVAVASGQLARFEREIIRAATPAEARILTRKIHAALMEGTRDYADLLEAEADALDAAAAEPAPVEESS